MTSFSFGVYSDIHVIENPSYGLTRAQWQRVLTQWRDSGALFGMIVGDLGYAADVDNVLSGPGMPCRTRHRFFTGWAITSWMRSGNVHGSMPYAPGAVQPGSWTSQLTIAPGNADRAYWSFNVGPRTHFIVLDGRLHDL